ncbi:MAG: PulJ/GspJ family protein [Phycisphaerales bacterium]
MIRRRAFTLIELVVSLAVVSILIGAMGSSIVLASRALPGSGSAAENLPTLQRAWAAIADDLRVASQVRIIKEDCVEMLVPDRNGGDTAQVVLYAWSGTAGDPLTRSVDGGDAAPLLAAVDDVEFKWASPDTPGRTMPHRLCAVITMGDATLCGEQRCLNAERLN